MNRQLYNNECNKVGTHIHTESVFTMQNESNSGINFFQVKELPDSISGICTILKGGYLK